jgi:aminomuconate-semialdehyde/2-hydroxymuconate-6-semialdehyde dehydrogenase
VPAAAAETFETRDPHDDSLVGRVARGDAADAARAVAAACRAFDEGPWPRMSTTERRKLLHALADRIDANADELALLETRDCGKPLRESRGHDMPRAASNFRFFADYADLAGNEAYPTVEHHAYTLYPPAGVAVAISPWNFPLMLASWKVAPALAFGNTVVLKPAEQSPMTASRLGELALEAGFPPGVLNVVHGFGPGEVGEALTRDSRVQRITFTGESGTGRATMRAAAENLIPVSFELGGKSANVVFEDADMDAALAGAIRSIFGNKRRGVPGRLPPPRAAFDRRGVHGAVRAGDAEAAGGGSEGRRDRCRTAGRASPLGEGGRLREARTRGGRRAAHRRRPT